MVLSVCCPPRWVMAGWRRRKEGLFMHPAWPWSEGACVQTYTHTLQNRCMSILVLSSSGMHIRMYILAWLQTHKWKCRKTHSILKHANDDAQFACNTRTSTSPRHCVGHRVSSSMASTAASPAPFANIFCLSVQTPLTHSPAGGPVNRAVGRGPCHLWGLGGGHWGVYAGGKCVYREGTCVYSGGRHAGCGFNTAPVASRHFASWASFFNHRIVCNCHSHVMV